MNIVDESVRQSVQLSFDLVGSQLQTDDDRPNLKIRHFLLFPLNPLEISLFLFDFMANFEKN